MKNIVIMGMPGSGKTIIAKMLAMRIERPHVDLDDVIAARNYTNVPGLKIKKSEEYFRDRESRIAHEASRLNEGAVISTGDGVVLMEENVQALKRNGICVLLRAPVDTLLRRLGENPLFMPLLDKEPNPRKKFNQMWKEREPLYKAAADVIVDTERLNLEQVVDEVVRQLKARPDSGL